MLRAFPIEDMIFWFLSPVTVLAEAFLILMAELTRPVKAAFKAMMHGPVTVMALRSYILPDLLMAGLACNRGVFSIVAFLADKHIRPLKVGKRILFLYPLVASIAFHTLMILMAELEVFIALRLFRHRFRDLIIMGCALYRVAQKTFFRWMIHVYLMALCALVHAWVLQFSLLTGGMAG
jgi:hypothetical protein